MQQQTLPRPAAAGSNVYVIPRADVPRDANEFRALERRIRSLREQLQDAAERRNSVAGNLRSADEQARDGYIERLKILDARIIGLETEISNSVARLAEAPPIARIQGTTADAPPSGVEVQNMIESAIPIVAIISVFGIAPIAIALSRFIWKRSTAPAVRAGPDRATQDRLEQLQQSMDAVAIEVERISEGQRYVTRIMNERGVGAGEPIAQKQAVRGELR